MSTSFLDRLPAWPQLSYVLAKELTKLDIPKSFLTFTEIESMNQALISFATWKEFIEPLDNNETHLTAFRVRAMLAEQFIPHVFHSGKPCCQHIKVNFAKLIQQFHVPDSSPIPTSSTIETANDQTPPNNTDHVPLLDIYHTLEFDMAAMIEKRKLEEYHAQQEEEAQQEVNEDSTLKILDETNEFNLKYLLKGIAQNRNKTSLSDRELRNLLSEVKPHRSKWANEDKVGQEDLYEACEKVLTDLKNYTEHSTPFLSKVNKRDAPDYFEVIKEPMDLGTVSKKLKSFQYKNKREFGNDLYLIYENCLIYNSDPSNEYRKHAIAMRRKTDRLMTRVPDIVVKERHDDESDEEDREGRGSTRERSITQDSVDEHVPQKHPAQQSLETVTEEEIIQMNKEIDTDKGELQNKIWRQVTKQTRANLTTDVEKQYQFDFGNRYALGRNSLDMERFSRLEHLHHQPETTKKLMRCSRTAFLRWLDRRDELTSTFDEFDMNSEDEEGFDGGFFYSTSKGDKAKPTDEDDAIRTDLFLPEYYLGSGIPEIDGVSEEYLPFLEEDENDYTMLSLDEYPATQLNRTGLGRFMDQNIEKLQRNRSIHRKCNMVKSNTALNVASEEVESPPFSPQMIDIGTPTPSRKPQLPQLTISKEAGYQMMQQSLTQILIHAGFEGAESNALNIITDIASRHFSNIGNTLRSYLDEHGKAMKTEDILSHSLSENGVPNIDDLENYIEKDIVHFGDKLDDTNRKLEHSYRCLTTESVTDESNLFEDETNAFITGRFDQDIGLDFFGFKELGLDEKLRVPSRLWYGEDAKEPAFSSKGPSQKYTPPPPFIPAVSATSFVGLLQPWYKKYFDENPRIVEDEYSPKKGRPRYPPVNVKSSHLQQDSTYKRRVLKDGSNTNTANEEAKRKRKRVLEETKAQKKQMKLEIKAQKIAEKEQKKRQREEEKLAKLKTT
ncbi:unnamed protein product [Mucor hiemalis]